MTACQHSRVWPGPKIKELTADELRLQYASFCFHCGHECSGESLERIDIDGMIELVEVCDPEQVCWAGDWPPPASERGVL